MRRVSVDDVAEEFLQIIAAVDIEDLSPLALD